MKPQLEFELDSKELTLVRTRYTRKNQLGLSVMLKFFQWEGYYPTDQEAISKEMITALANQ